MESIKNTLFFILISLLVLVIAVSMGINSFLFFKYIELKEIVEAQKREQAQVEVNRGTYLDLKTTIEEQRKEIIRLGDKNNLCVERLDNTIKNLERCEQDKPVNENKGPSEKNLID